MAVIINEVEHTAVAEASQETRGASDGSGSGGGAPSQAVIEAQILATIRREAARTSRLWAD